MASTQYSSTVTYVFATENDVNGGSSGFGDTLQEPTLGPLLKALGGASPPGGIISGFTLPSSGSASDRAVGASSLARVGAYLVGAGAAGYTVSFPYATTYVFLRLLRDGASKVTAAVVECSDSMTPPADAIPLGTVTTSGGNITGLTDTAPLGKLVHGAFTTTGPAVTDPGSGDWAIAFNSPYYDITGTAPAFRREPFPLFITPTPDVTAYSSGAFRIDPSATGTHRFVLLT